MNIIKKWLSKIFRKKPEYTYEIVIPPIKKTKPKREFRRKHIVTHYPKCPVQFKTSYNEEVAKREAVRLGNKQIKLRAYRCAFCPHWHLTHQSNRLKRH